MRAFSLDGDFPFFGRDRECEELLQHLRHSRFLTVIGGSCSGKSSLVFAGLVPRLRKSTLLMVVTACPDGAARILDASNGRLIGELHGHRARLGSAKFSPDGRRVVTASEDKSARIWSLDPLPGDPGTIGLWAEVMTGTEREGQRGLTAFEWNDRRRRLRALGDKAPPSPWLKDLTSQVDSR